VTTVGFQSGAVEFAKANGIALLVAKGTNYDGVCYCQPPMPLDGSLQRLRSVVNTVLSLDLDLSNTIERLEMREADGLLVSSLDGAQIQIVPGEMAVYMAYLSPCLFNENTAQPYFEVGGSLPLSPDRLLKLVLIERVLLAPRTS
jgi:hypothetical protein